MKLKWTLSDTGTWSVASCVGHVVTAMSNQANGWWRIGGVEVSGICRGVSLVDMQEAAEAALARMLAEDEGVEAMMGTRLMAKQGDAMAMSARVAELDYRREMVAECAYVVEQERDALRARVAELERGYAALCAMLGCHAGDVAETIERLQSAARWIPVGESLPDDETIVVEALDDDGVVLATCVDDGRRGEWWPTHDSRRADGVTHWRPLPVGPDVAQIAGGAK